MRPAILIALMSVAVAAPGVVVAQSIDGPSAAASCTYTVTIPGAGVIWNTGSFVTITWVASGICSSNVDMRLYRESDEVRLIGSSIPNSGSTSWTVTAGLATALEYRIRIQDKDDFESVGFSSNFIIVNPTSCGYRVTDPEDGTEWLRGAVETIRWTRAGSCGSPVDLQLMRNEQVIETIATSILDSGSTTWLVPNSVSAGGNYRVRVRDSNDFSAFDRSPVFSIGDAPSCSFDIAEPDGDTVWTLGESASIAWSSSGGCSGQVDLLLLESGEEVAAIASAIDDSGSTSWTVADDLEPGSDYAVQVRDSSTPGVSDTSDAFTIEEPDPEPMTTTSWIEIASHQAGAAGSLWRTDVVVRNLTESAANVEIRMRDAGDVPPLSSVVPGGAQGVFEDVVGQMGFEGKGWLEITTDRGVLVEGRIYNLGGGGSFGQYLPGYPTGEGFGEGDEGWILQLRQLEGEFRTNLTFTNPTTAAATVRVTLYDSAGNELLSYVLDIGAERLVQDLEPFDRRADRPNLGWGMAQVRVLEGSSVLISGSVVDSRTNDATTVPVRIEPAE